MGIRASRVAAGLGFVVLSAGAFAADAIDTSAVTTAIVGAGAAIAVCGAAYLAMKVGGKVWKWIATVL